MRRMAVVVAVVALLLPGCGIDRSTAAPWNLRGPAVGQVLRLRIGIGSSSCDRLGGVKVREGPDDVRVIATVERNRSKRCSSDYAAVDRDVELSQPLGTRRLSGCRPPGPLTLGHEFGGRETESTCFETSSITGP